MATRAKKSKGSPAWWVIGGGCAAHIVACTRVQTITLDDGKQMHYVKVGGVSRLLTEAEVFATQEEALREVVSRHDKDLAEMQSLRDSYAKDLERLEGLRKAMQKGLGDART